MDEIYQFDIRMFDNLYEGIYCIGLDNKIFYWNKACEELTGYTSNEVCNTFFWYDFLNFITVDDEEHKFNMLPLYSTMEKQLPIETIVLLNHKNKTSIPVSIKSESLMNSLGEIVGILVMINSVSFFNEIEYKINILENMAMFDQLTQIPNRRYTRQLLGLKGKEYLKKMNKFSLIFIDIDNFKKINDKYGHRVGDLVLQEVAVRLKKMTSEDESLGRWGGEEFIIISSSKTKEALRKQSESIREAIKTEAFDVETEKITVTVSIGATLVKSGYNLDDMIEQADKLMYNSKSNGKDMVTVD